MSDLTNNISEFFELKILRDEQKDQMIFTSKRSLTKEELESAVNYYNSIGLKANIIGENAGFIIELEKQPEPDYEGDPLHSCKNCGDYCTGTYCHRCEYQNMVDDFS